MPADFDPWEGGAQQFNAYPVRPSDRIAAAVWVVMSTLTLLSVLFSIFLWWSGALTDVNSAP
jgi:hypothetical protein